MLKIKREFVDRALRAASPQELHELLQGAIELEHATIPVYLTAMISLKPGQNREIWRVIHSVVIEEMLHFCIAANVINALGGRPVINKPGFVPAYPGPLPMHINGSLVVGLEPFSKALVKDVFMEIEEPEDPLVFPVKAFGAAAAPPTFATIGQFYRAIQEKIDELAPDRLPGDPARQVANHSFFSDKDLFPVTTKREAIEALRIIVEQGEGTSTSPVDETGELAHYYRFEELYVGRRLVVDPASPEGYSFSGAVFPFDAQGVYPLAPNTKAADLPGQSEQRRQADQFNRLYTSLLDGLHRTFDGQPGALDATFGLMYDLKLVGERLAAMEYPGKSENTVGPPFEFNPAVAR
ncbi:MAG: ferritin-like protein [Cytophagales bacterium]|nr:ferritin-like protein [Cytophagales bacterium]